MPHKCLPYFFITVVLVLASCNNPLNQKYSESHFEQDLRTIAESHNTDTTDMIYMTMYVVQAKDKKERLDGQTYKQILKTAKERYHNIDKEKINIQAFAQRQAHEEDKRKLKFSRILTITLCGKNLKKGDFEDYLEYDILFENKSGKDIKELQGSLKLIGPGDVTLQDLRLNEEIVISSGKTLKKNYRIEYQDFKDGDVLTSRTDIKDLKTEWRPNFIIFRDGSSVE